MEARIGVDIGGGGVRAAVVEAGRMGTVVAENLSDRTVGFVVDTIVRVIEQVGSDAPVGLGVPGFVHDQHVLASPNFPTWREVPLAELLAERLKRPVTIENDANCATLGIWRERGAHEDLVVLTLGTGVGGGVVMQGELLRGATGTGAELGHIYAGGDAPCGCGGLGCLEQWCGTVGLIRLAAASGHSIADGRELVQAAEQGRQWAASVLRRAAQGLGRGLVTLVNLFNPDVVVISGGLAHARDWLAPPAEDWLRRYGIAASVDHARVVWVGPADRFAILGAAEVAR